MPLITAAARCAVETILLVEDDDAVRRLTRRMLEGLGYRVHAASSGAEALAILDSCDESIALVLCDIVMPDVDGPEVVRRVRIRHTGMRALFMSGHTTDSLVQSGTLNEAEAFIHKPFRPDALAKKVREVLDA